MEERDLIEKLQTLKNISPSEERVSSARDMLVLMIENEQPEPSVYGGKAEAFSSRLEGLLVRPRWAMAFTLGMFMLLAVGTGVAQNSLPGSTLYPVKIASEEVRKATKLDPLASANFAASLAERRVDEVSRLAEISLEPEEATGLVAYLQNYKIEIEEAKTTGDTEVIEQRIAQVAERVEELKTSVTSDAETRREREALIRENIENALADCSAEELKGEVEELLATGLLSDLLKAHELALRCPAEEAEEATTTTESITTTTTDE